MIEIERIALPTDLTAASSQAFIHALRLAMLVHCGLDLMHVKVQGEDTDWSAFPHVREVLARWGVMDLDDQPSEIPRNAGVSVRKVEITHADGPAAGVYAYIMQHATALVITAPHARGGLLRWVTSSVSERISRTTHRPTLFVADDMRPFVDTDTGAVGLGRVLVPVDHTPDPAQAVVRLDRLFANFGLAPDYVLLHVGGEAPRVVDAAGSELPVAMADGDVVLAIQNAAEIHAVDMIAMPTAGHDSLADMMRGSTTERVMRASKLPLLALPV
jgi:nucleotide-binding universal stress UspA family protein